MSEESKKKSFMQRMGTAAILVPVLLVLLIVLMIPKRPRYHRGGDDFEIQ